MRYSGRTVVDELSLSAPAGQITIVLGPNGAGKTTTIETAEGFRVPHAGTVRVLGLDPQADAYVHDIFGHHATVVDRIEQLPERLTRLFVSLTK